MQNERQPRNSSQIRNLDQIDPNMNHVTVTANIQTLEDHQNARQNELETIKEDKRNLMFNNFCSSEDSDKSLMFPGISNSLLSCDKNATNSHTSDISQANASFPAENPVFHPPFFSSFPFFSSQLAKSSKFFNSIFNSLMFMPPFPRPAAAFGNGN